MFKQYSWFSVQVDQYYAAVRIYARNHKDLRSIYDTVKSISPWPDKLGTGIIPEAVEKLFMLTSSHFNYMGTTGIFQESSFPELTELPIDMVNFGFYTCFCFQWTLFENFVKNSLLDLVTEGLVSGDSAKELQKRKHQTALFLSYIDSGKVFGRSPFITVLPVTGWVPKTEICDFKDLTKIRELRNDFIHGINDSEIMPISEIEKERLYSRSMWIMRNFAGNVDQEINKIRSGHSA
ncbi:MAG: hypothetical protein GWO38_22655 [Phycisphaerae bacterium]|nr:hypothetical protein [Phycisphaerae bacterium]NIX30364.1 hypothetical protein [Phycisphaerae bacterium]